MPKPPKTHTHNPPEVELEFVVAPSIVQAINRVEHAIKDQTQAANQNTAAITFSINAQTTAVVAALNRIATALEPPVQKKATSVRIVTEPEPLGS